MSRRDIYSQPTRYNNVFSSNTQAPSPDHGIDAPRHLTQLRRDSQASASSSSSRSNTQLRLTQLQRDVSRPARRQELPPYQAQDAMNTQSASIPGAATTAPPSAKSHFKDSHDFAMASKQVRYEELSRQEQIEQDSWASSYSEHAGPCPAGFDWVRVQQGYICNGGHHLMTDALVAEGKGGFYVGSLHMGWWGPYYSAEGVLSMPMSTGRPILQATHEEHPTIERCRAGGVPYPAHVDPRNVSNNLRLFAQLSVNNPGSRAGQMSALALLGRQGQVRYTAQHISYHDSHYGSRHHHNHVIHHNHSGSRLGDPNNSQPRSSDTYR
ncbi:hypothetical protein CJF31_00010433 [Rutstroemia sp. NJR-2017a BVV2]|nr:hypothetical protein CJF31_00010433 [Rutstroemia sp. NJR-2017a BVV2]